MLRVLPGNKCGITVLCSVTISINIRSVKEGANIDFNGRIFLQLLYFIVLGKNIYWVLCVLCHENVGALIWCPFSVIKEMNNVSIKAAIASGKCTVSYCSVMERGFLGTM